MNNSSDNVYCTAPWLNAYIEHNGNVFPCCHWIRFEPLGNIKNDSLMDIFNSDLGISNRIEMLKGKSNSSCGDCHFFEKHHEKSLRNYYLDNQLETLRNQGVPSANGRMENLDIRYLSIAVGTQCQLYCRTCGPSESSTWQAKLGLKNSAPVTVGMDEKSRNRIFETIEKSVHLERLLLLGGEPFINTFHYDILEYITSLKRSTLPELHYNSNLYQLEWKNYSLKKIWTPFPKVNLFISIDGDQTRFGYVRTGHSWGRLKKNLIKIQTEFENVVPSAYLTISNYNFLYLDKLLDDVISDLKFDVNKIHFNFVKNPIQMNIACAPVALKKLAESRINKYIKILLSRYEVDKVLNLIKLLRAVVNFMYSANLPSESFQNFLEFNKNNLLPESCGRFESLFSELLLPPPPVEKYF